jgi:hypothetical protein
VMDGQCDARFPPFFHVALSLLCHFRVKRIRALPEFCASSTAAGLEETQYLVDWCLQRRPSFVSGSFLKGE